MNYGNYSRYTRMYQQELKTELIKRNFHLEQVLPTNNTMALSDDSLRADLDDGTLTRFVINTSGTGSAVPARARVKSDKAIYAEHDEEAGF